MYLCSGGYVTDGHRQQVGQRAGGNRASVAAEGDRPTGDAGGDSDCFRAGRCNDGRFRRDDPEEPRTHSARSTTRRCPNLVLPDSAASQLAVNRLEKDFLKGLRGLFPGFDGYPQTRAARAGERWFTRSASAGWRRSFRPVVKACREWRVHGCGEIQSQEGEGERGPQGRRARRGHTQSPPGSSPLDLFRSNTRAGNPIVKKHIRVSASCARRRVPERTRPPR